MTNYKAVFTNTDSFEFKAKSLRSAKIKISNMLNKGYGSLNIVDMDKKETIAFKSESNNLWVNINNPDYINKCLNC